VISRPEHIVYASAGAQRVSGAQRLIVTAACARRYSLAQGNKRGDARCPGETERDWLMRHFSKITTAVALAVSTATAISIPAPADARHRHHYYSRTHYYYRYCRRSSGTTGLVAGGVAGALVGRSVLGHGLLGTAGGAVGGALAGRAIDRSVTARRRCRYYR
jgi:hypothetical protein